MREGNKVVVGCLPRKGDFLKHKDDPYKVLMLVKLHKGKFIIQHSGTFFQLREWLDEKALENQINLCDSCCNEIPTCECDNVIYDNGVGNDNVAACISYVLLMTR